MSFLTPNSAPYPPRYRALLVPDSVEWITLVSGALIELAYRQNWEMFGTMTPEEAAVEGELILDSWLSQDKNMLIGQIVMAAWELTPPNYLACDGATHLAEDYPQLYAIIDPAYWTTLGAEPAFRVPDLRGRFPRGTGTGSGLSTVAVDEAGGSEEKTLSVSNLPPHQHTYFKPGINIDLESPGAPDIFAGGAGIPDVTGLEGGGSAFDVLNPYLGVSFYILAKV